MYIPARPRRKQAHWRSRKRSRTSSLCSFLGWEEPLSEELGAPRVPHEARWRKDLWCVCVYVCVCVCACQWWYSSLLCWSKKSSTVCVCVCVCVSLYTRSNFLTWKQTNLWRSYGATLPPYRMGLLHKFTHTLIDAQRFCLRLCCVLFVMCNNKIPEQSLTVPDLLHIVPIGHDTVLQRNRKRSLYACMYVCVRTNFLPIRSKDADSEGSNYMEWFSGDFLRCWRTRGQIYVRHARIFLKKWVRPIWIEPILLPLDLCKLLFSTWNGLLCRIAGRLSSCDTRRALLPLGCASYTAAISWW